MLSQSSRWLKISLVNLLIVALLGLLMRYKIGFEFPYFDQKSVQHSHSHFAFAGWISHTLMVLMIGFLERNVKPFYVAKYGQRVASYNRILILNLICAYGMLISFIIQGYGGFSITFSTISILVSYLFGYQFWNDLKSVDATLISVNWFKAAIFFNLISSFGTFALAYMMITKNIHQSEYLASIYYYLHFQYNGWFFFACIGLLGCYLNLKTTDHPFFIKAFRMFFVACIPAYFLSALWLDLPSSVYFSAVTSAILQLIAWIPFMIIIVKIRKQQFEQLPYFLKYILLFVAVALNIKLLLQLGSTVPALSQLAFGFRPIVIAYLHLVLLAIISLFLLFYIFANGYIATSTPIRFGLILFSIGVFLNEFVLAIQGVGSFSYTLVPYVNELLFGIAVVLVIGIAVTVYHSLKQIKIS